MFINSDRRGTCRFFLKKMFSSTDCPHDSTGTCFCEFLVSVKTKFNAPSDLKRELCTANRCYHCRIFAVLLTGLHNGLR